MNIVGPAQTLRALLMNLDNTKNIVDGSGQTQRTLLMDLDENTRNTVDGSGQT